MPKCDVREQAPGQATDADSSTRPVRLWQQHANQPTHLMDSLKITEGVFVKSPAAPVNQPGLKA